MPKRQLFHGPVSPFDWEGEAAKIREAREANLARSSSNASDYSTLAIASGTEESDCPATPTPPPAGKVKVKAKVKKERKFDADSLKTCHECGIAVWIGPADAAVAGVGIACPTETDWGSAKNQEPYCAACWEKENGFLEKMAAGYKVGIPP